MPSTTPKEARLMAAVAHGWHKPGGGGPSVKVAKEFNKADKGTTMLSKGMKPQTASYAAGGPVLGKESSFMKVKDEFRDADEGDASADEDQNYAKSGAGAGKGFVKPPGNTKKVIK
jgi:hypothetical protein